MGFGQVVTFFRQRDIDDTLPALVFVENDLLVVGPAFHLAGKHVGNLDNLVPTDHAILHRPVDIALLRIDRLSFRECHDEVAASQGPIIDFPTWLSKIAALDQLDIAADNGNDVLPFLQPCTVDDGNIRIGHAKNNVDILRR